MPRISKKPWLFVCFFLLFSFCFPFSASAAENRASIAVQDWKSLSDAFNENEGAAVIELTEDIACQGALTAKSGCAYVIQGNGHTLTDVKLEGSGQVEIAADLIGKDGMAALDVTDTQFIVTGTLTTYPGQDSRCIFAQGNASGEIYGDCLDSTNEAESVVATNDDARITLHGDIKGGWGYTVSSSGTSELTVYGNVYAIGGRTERPVTSFDDSKMTIHGDIIGVPGTYLSGAIDNSTLVVDGNVNSGLEVGPMFSSGGPTVRIGGNLSNACSDNYCLSVSGAVVTIGGSIKSSSATSSAILMGSDAVLTVGGSVTNTKGGALEIDLVDSTPGRILIEGSVSAGGSAPSLSVTNFSGLSGDLPSYLPKISIGELKGEVPIGSGIPGMVEAVEENLAANQPTPAPTQTPEASPAASMTPPPEGNKTPVPSSLPSSQPVGLSPQTGDTASIAPYALLGTCALLGLVCLLAYKKLLHSNQK